MNGRVLLDTPIVIALFAKESLIQDRLTRATEVFVPSIVLGELYYGARKSARVEDNPARIDEFAASTSVLVCNTETAHQYGQIKQGLKAKGRPLPENDIWIAAVARQYGLTVVSRDDHFQEVDGLSFEKW
jgi:tRNA(fMet)-specific endonuclease VapC